MLAPDARFCSSCGTRLETPSPEERKVVTVLFADLTASTELAAAVDPERFHEVVTAFYREVVEELESLRGRAESFAGDAVVGVFGLPQTHDDDGLRAVRAALSIRDRVSRLGERFVLPVPLQVRVGVTTGPVAVVTDPSVRSIVLGAVVNLAARLQSAAAPGEILVGETTRQLTNEAARFGDRREVTAKGFADKVVAWPVVALEPRYSRRTIPMVDRKYELKLLTDAFERVREMGRVHLITLLGEAGIGKSRLVQELLAWLPEEAKVLTGGASILAEDITFAPLAEMVRRELGVERETPDEEVRKRLEQTVEGCCDPTESEQVVARIGMALGLGARRADEPEREGAEGAERAERAAEWDERLESFAQHVNQGGGEELRYRGAEIRAGLVSFVTGLARLQPVVLVFEDVHLAQPAFLELVEQTVREARRIPLLVLCAGRWELLEARPGWAGGIADALSLHLEPLSAEDSAQLAREAGEGIDDDTAERITQHAGGNPFFIVETTGMLMHEEAEAVPGVASSGRRIPPTVQAVVAARIDHLAPDARELIRRASVFAQGIFHEYELELIAEPSEDTLRALEDEELLAREEGREGVWRFRHGLLRDVAYESLSKRDRRELHLRVADGLESHGKGRHPRSVAYHLDQAARASLDLDPGDRELPDRAIKALTNAGDLARRAIDSRDAIHTYENALSLAGPENSWGPREAWMLSGIGEARYWLGEFEPGAASLERALELGGEDPWVRAHASRFLADITLAVRGDREKASPLFDQALSAARELDDPWTLARTLLQAGWLPYWTGDWTGSRDIFREALEVVRANPEGDPWAEARALIQLAVITSSFEDEQEALSLARAALEIGERTGDRFTAAAAKVHVANSLRRMWRLDEALPFAEGAVQSFREFGAKWETADALISRSVVHRAAGRLDQAEAGLDEALELCRELKERSLLSWAASMLATVHLMRKEPEAARRVVQEAIGWSPDLGGPGGDFGWAETLLALAEGDREGARARAIRELEAAADAPNETATMTWWVGSLFGHDAVGGEGELERARERLEEVHQIFALKEPELLGVESWTST